MTTLAKIKTFFKTDLGSALVITIGWKLVISIIGFVIATLTTHSASFFGYTTNWDGGWYLTVIHSHYTTPGSSAFYPLFPSLVAGLHFVSFGLINEVICGQIINTVAVFFALLALVKISRLLLGERQRFWPLILFLAAPAAFFLHVFYSEAVFAAVGFWAYYFALKQRWMFVGISLGVLTAARLPSLLFIALCGLEFLRIYRWNIKKILNKQLLWFLLAPVGFIIFGIYLSISQHHFLAMFSAYHAVNDWSYQVFNLNIFETILQQCYQVVRMIIGLRPLNEDLIVNCLTPLACLIVLAACSLFLVVQKRNRQLLPLGIFGFLSIILFTLNSNIVSVQRYVLPILTIYIALPLLATTKKRFIILIGLCILSVLLQAVLYFLFIDKRFAG